MATFKPPFAYNTGGPIDGTTQYDDLVVGNVNVDYSSDYGGVKWWASPEESTGDTHQTYPVRNAIEINDSVLIFIAHKMDFPSGISRPAKLSNYATRGVQHSTLYV